MLGMTQDFAEVLKVYYVEKYFPNKIPLTTSTTTAFFPLSDW